MITMTKNSQMLVAGIRKSSHKTALVNGREERDRSQIHACARATLSSDDTVRPSASSSSLQQQSHSRSEYSSTTVVRLESIIMPPLDRTSMFTAPHDAIFPRSPTSSLSGTQQNPPHPPTTAFRHLPIVGAEWLANAVWYRSKAILKGVLAHENPDTPSGPHQPHWFLPEIIEMIIVHLAYDTPTLKACAATCFSWYNVATPYLYHTLTLRRWSKDISHNHLNPLVYLDKLGLLPFVKRVQFEKALFAVPWVVPSLFHSQNTQHFSALANLQDLAIADLDFSTFPAGPGEYFAHFSPTLRSVALSCPKGTRRQILDFFKLFPKLDDIKISYYHARPEAYEALDTQLIPIRGGLRGRLTLRGFGEEGLLKDIIVAFGGIRFTSMDLRNVRGMRLLLEACADTLETVNILPDSIFQRGKRAPAHLRWSPRHSSLRCCASISPELRLLMQYRPSVYRGPTALNRKPRVVETRSCNQRTSFHHHNSCVLRDHRCLF